MLGAEGQMLEDCVTYGKILLPAICAYILQYEFQCLFSTAEKPKLGLYITVAAGLTNAFLDALFIIVFQWGLQGAAAATAIGQCIGGLLPILYFARPNTSLLRLTKARLDAAALLKVCINGSSELMSNVSTSLVSMLYNVQLLHYAGEDGVAAYGVLMYVNLIFLSAFIGFSVGVSPVVGYHSGAGNYDELKGLLKKSFIITGVFSILMFLASQALAKPLSLLFVSYDKELLDMTLRGFFIFAFSFLFAGFAIFGSAFFTALGGRPDFRADLLSADAGLPDPRRAAPAAYTGPGRHMDLHRGRGNSRRYCCNTVSARQTEQVSLLITAGYLLQIFAFHSLDGHAARQAAG